jgi:hypothetical protein
MACVVSNIYFLLHVFSFLLQVIHVPHEKMEMILPSIFLFKTYGFSHQRHVIPLKLRHVAAIFFLIF